MTIRKAIIDDLDSILYLDQLVLKTNWHGRLYLQEMEIPESYFLVLYLDDQFIGYLLIRVIIDEAEIMQFAINPDYQNQGFGQNLYDSAYNYILEVQAKTIYLEVETLNQKAIKFYEKNGFENIHLRKDYYGPDKHANVMRKKMTP